MKKIYCLSGLGADERIFTRLHLHGVELIHIPWPDYDEHDELPCYAQKVAVLIDDENPVVLGVSLGGMIGVEICKMRPVRKLILVSSAKTRHELPPYDGNLFGWLMKSKIVPPFLYKLPNQVLYDKFGAESDEDEALLSAILKDSDGRFMKWAMRAVALWQNDEVPDPVAHIHGRQDKMLLPDNVNADYWIEDGGHIMIFNRAELVSRFVQKEIDNL